MIGVENVAGVIDEHHALAKGVEIAAGDVDPRLPAADANQAEREQKQHRHADDGEHGEEAEHQRLHALALDEHEADRHTDQAEGEDDQASGAADAVWPVAGQVEPWGFVDPLVHPGPSSPIWAVIDRRASGSPGIARSGRAAGRSATPPLAGPVLISRE